jgi:hypothetical protein
MKSIFLLLTGNRFVILFLFVLFITPVNNFAQDPGDTIKIQAFEYNSTSHDSTISFPDLDDVTYEKIVLKYSMHCDDDNGCGSWDYTCNTYVVDSTKVEEVENYVSRYYITNYESTIFSYKNTPVYDYYRGTQTQTNITSTTNEVAATVGDGDITISGALQTDSIAGKSQFLYLASELSSAGLSSGDINGLGLDVLSTAGDADYLKIKIKQTSQTVIYDNDDDSEDFTEVYYNNVKFEPSQVNRLQFNTPFTWDGSSNILVEFSFSNIVSDNYTGTNVEGSLTSDKFGINATNDKHLLLTNSAYVECDSYTGVMGSTNRTIEAWIKTTSSSDAEICSWGAVSSGAKWVFRLNTSGKLRAENGNGNTTGSISINDGYWHHVACVLDGDNLADISLYVDGEKDENASNGSTDIYTTEDYKVRISRGTNDRYLDAEVDQVRIWDTNVSAATLKTWMSLKVDETHPNYDNLQLCYDFNESGESVIDNSDNSRNGKIYGTEYRVDYTNGVDIFQGLALQDNRPNTTFYQGEYVTSSTETTVDRPVDKTTDYFVSTVSIESASSDSAIDDSICYSDPVEYWLPEESYYDEATDTLISTIELTADGELNLDDSLVYYTRYPFYIELVSFVTPYGNGLDLGDGKSWYFDMSDYVSLLKGDKRLKVYGTGSFTDELDLEFWFIVGTPPRDVLQFEQIWQGTSRLGRIYIEEILADTYFSSTNIDLDAEAESFKLKSSITGHDTEGEFAQNGGCITHKILINSKDTLAWDITQECSMNPIFPQGGTWVTDRQGWCPGQRTLLKEQNITEYVNAESTMSIDYTTSEPDISDGDYSYHVAHQIIAYGEANHKLDAAVADVVAPNNAALYTRVGTICANPTIIIQNTGSDTLTSLTIEYWINDALTPQTYQWTGSLEFLEKEEVEIDYVEDLWYDLASSSNKFHVEISEPNGGTDEYEYNNTFTSSFDLTDTYSDYLVLEFLTNNNPDENSYVIYDEVGDTVASNNLSEANTIYNDTLSLEDGCYKLIVEDSGDDGIDYWASTAQGEGYILLKNENSETLETFEPDFGGGFEYSFSVDYPLTYIDYVYVTSIEVYPNPVETYCNVILDDYTDVEIFVRDISGQIVDVTVDTDYSSYIELNMESLSTGIYFISIQKGDILTTRKVTKK